MSSASRFVSLVLVTLGAGALATGCDDIVTDPNFHTWCGDQLCSWKLDSGKIQRAPTWHPKDYGVELLDSTDASHVTSISQVSDTTATCLELSTVADVAPEAQVSIGFDFNDDGSVDREQTIASVGFTEQKFQVTAPLAYDHVRFVIAKKGTGRAVLAQMEVKSVSNCTAAPVVPHAEHLGTKCSEQNGGDECSSGVCSQGLCAECSGTSPLGVAGCPNNGTCAARIVPSTVGDGVTSKALPLQCDPGKGKHAAGTECLLGDDCTSGVCTGTVWSALDLGKSFAPCPGSFPFGPTCSITSVRAGRCE
jgi:hypothetical protein